MLGLKGAYALLLSLGICLCVGVSVFPSGLTLHKLLCQGSFRFLLFSRMRVRAPSSLMKQKSKVGAVCVCVSVCGWLGDLLHTQERNVWVLQFWFRKILLLWPNDCGNFLQRLLYGPISQVNLGQI